MIKRAKFTIEREKKLYALCIWANIEEKYKHEAFKLLRFLESNGALENKVPSTIALGLLQHVMGKNKLSERMQVQEQNIQYCTKKVDEIINNLNNKINLKNMRGG